MLLANIMQMECNQTCVLCERQFQTDFPTHTNASPQERQRAETKNLISEIMFTPAMLSQSKLVGGIASGDWIQVGIMWVSPWAHAMPATYRDGEGRGRMKSRRKLFHNNNHLLLYALIWIGGQSTRVDGGGGQATTVWHTHWQDRRGCGGMGQRHRARSTSPMKLRLESRIHYRFPSAVCPLPHSKPQFTG